MSMPTRHASSDTIAATAGGLERDLVDPSASAAWSIISYIISGILFWGVLGLLLDRWLFAAADDVKLFLPIGVIVGTAAGAYLGYMRYLQVTNAYTTAQAATSLDAGVAPSR